MDASFVVNDCTETYAHVKEKFRGFPLKRNQPMKGRENRIEGNHVIESK